MTLAMAGVHHKPTGTSSQPDLSNYTATTENCMGGRGAIADFGISLPKGIEVSRDDEMARVLRAVGTKAQR